MNGVVAGVCGALCTFVVKNSVAGTSLELDPGASYNLRAVDCPSGLRCGHASECTVMVNASPAITVMSRILRSLVILGAPTTERSESVTLCNCGHFDYNLINSQH